MAEEALNDDVNDSGQDDAQDNDAQDTLADDAQSSGDKSDQGGDVEKTWRDFITSDEFKKEAEKSESLDAVFERIAQMRKTLSDRVALPGADATDEEIARFRKAMKVPETAEGYNLPEGVEFNDIFANFVEQMKPTLHEANVSESAFEKMVQTFADLDQQMASEISATVTKIHEESVANLKTEWGNDYDANVNVAHAALKQFGGDELISLMDDVKTADGGRLGDHPVLIKFAAKLGRQMGEDGVIAPMDTNTASDLEEQIEKLTSEAHAAQHGGDRAKMNKLFQERDKLAERLYGDSPI
jgi:hypothetical protein